jgi:hypothetical protein
MIPLFGRRQKGRQAIPAKPRRSTTPQIEELEDRWVPSTLGSDTSQITPPVVTAVAPPTISVTPLVNDVTGQSTTTTASSSCTTPPSTVGSNSTTTVAMNPQTSAFLMGLLESLASLRSGHSTNTTTCSNPPATTPSSAPAVGSLSGFVYQDNNVNGIKDTGDTGVQGVTVALTGNNMNQTATTDSTGAYQFSNLPAGTYTINATQPSGFDPGTNNVGSLGGSVSGNTFTVALPSAGNGTNYNFGETLPPTNVPVIPSTTPTTTTTTTQDTCSHAEMQVTLMMALQFTLPVCDMPTCTPPTTPPPTTTPNVVPIPLPPTPTATTPTPTPTPSPTPTPTPPSDPGSPPASPPAFSKRDFIGNAWKSMV